MQKLSPELLLLIISYLNPVDIYHLQKTRKEFCSLIEEFAGSVWRECLRLQCLRNGVFFPSFKDLTEPAQFKRAATSSVRFIRTYERATLDDPPAITAEKSVVKLQMDNADLLDFYLVQGGRFLITLEPTRIAMWDLSGTSTQASLLLRCSNEHGAAVLQATRIVNSTTILLLFTLAHPRNHPSFESASSTLFGQYATEYLILEIGQCDNGSGFEVQRERHLCVKAPFDPIATSFTFFNDMVSLSVLDLDTGSTIAIVWNYVDSNIVTLCFAGDILGTVLRRNHVFYILPGSITVVQIPSPQPIKDECLELTNSVRYGLAKPVVQCRLGSDSIDVGRFKEWSFTGPDILNPSHLEDQPLVFELMEDIGARGQFQLRHYGFHFNTKHPAKSTVWLKEAYRVKCGDAKAECEDELKPVFTRVCNGRNTALWIDDCTSPPTPYLVAYPSVDYSLGVPSKTAPRFVKWTPELPDYERNWDYLYETCPVSGKIALLKNDILAGEPFIECYSFLQS